MKNSILLKLANKFGDKWFLVSLLPIAAVINIFFETFTPYGNSFIVILLELSALILEIFALFMTIKFKKIVLF